MRLQDPFHVARFHVCATVLLLLLAKKNEDFTLRLCAMRLAQPPNDENALENGGLGLTYPMNYPRAQGYNTLNHQE